MQIEIDYKKLKNAIERNPRLVRDETNKFLVRSQGAFKQSINQSPWRVGGGGGGVPVLTGNLKKSHDYELKPFELRITVNERKADYASPVHKGRPWLEYAEKNSKTKINEFAVKLLQDITADLGK